jgi:hypothetical protein
MLTRFKDTLDDLEIVIKGMEMDIHNIRENIKYQSRISKVVVDEALEELKSASCSAVHKEALNKIKYECEYMTDWFISLMSQNGYAAQCDILKKRRRYSPSSWWHRYDNWLIALLMGRHKQSITGNDGEEHLYITHLPGMRHAKIKAT